MSPLNVDTQIKRWSRCLEGDSEWAKSLSLPLKNPFVPTDFNIRCSEGDAEVAITSKKPQLIQRITTLKEEEDEEVEEVVAVISDAVIIALDEVTLSTKTETETEAELKAETLENEVVESQVVEEVEEDEEEQEEEDAGGQLPPPVGKVKYPELTFLPLCAALSHDVPGSVSVKPSSPFFRHRTSSYVTLLHFASPYLTLPYFTLSCLMLPHLVLSHLTVPCLSSSYFISSRLMVYLTRWI